MSAHHIHVCTFVFLINWNLVKDGDAVRRVVVPQQHRHLHLPAELRPAKHINVFFGGTRIVFLMKFESDKSKVPIYPLFLLFSTQLANLSQTPELSLFCRCDLWDGRLRICAGHRSGIHFHPILPLSS